MQENVTSTGGTAVPVTSQTAGDTTVYQSTNAERTSGPTSTKEQARAAASEVAGTAKEQAREVAHEVTRQTKSMASDVRHRVGEQARAQNERLAGTVRRLADELDEMASGRDDSPARTVVTRLASGGRQAADYLAERGPEGVLREVQEFARRRPGAFVATAIVTGFVVGRLGKSIWSADSGDTAPGGSTIGAVPVSGNGGTAGSARATTGYSTTGYETEAPTIIESNPPGPQATTPAAMPVPPDPRVATGGQPR